MFLLSYSIDRSLTFLPVRKGNHLTSGVSNYGTKRGENCDVLTLDIFLCMS